ncbi:esterase-like activity of phytase family protein [Maritalea sp.]|uniref:esterase-like activity of phytase family protein n=1 Tax=Maritalea sp. TaxID=2003361 RepID=UPI003EF63CB7
MKSAHILGAIAFSAVSFTALSAAAAPHFNRIASFPVASNIPADMDAKSESSSEIIAATEDGMTLVYSDSPLGGLGFVDIADPKAPKPAGFMALGGEPTSVSIAAGIAFVGVNTSESYVAPSGNLAIIDIASKTVVASCDLGGQPDSVAVSKDGSLVAVAIENERDEDLNDGELPQLPAGMVTIFDIESGMANCDSMKVVDLTGLAEIGGTDPEAEFVDFNSQNEIVVSMQENNHYAIIDGKTGEVKNHFSAGSVDLEYIDIDEERAFTFDGAQAARLREPDAVKWLDDNRFVGANEGDYKGGSRSFTIYNKDGSVAFESNTSLEVLAARAGHYPEKRSGNKGVEPEGLATGKFGDDMYFFVLLERASMVGVYKDTGAAPEFVQLLPSGIGPEGALTIPSRNLFVSANEVDLIEDGGVRSHVMIYELQDAPAAYPQIMSDMADEHRPIGWVALSGLVADADVAGKLYAVNDSFLRAQPSIYEIDATSKPAKITKRIGVTRDGAPAQKLDLEGIALDGKGGFWLASEGRTDRLIPHAIYNVNAKGEIKAEIPFPAELLAVEKRFGSEGITVVGEGDDTVLWIAIQREWKDDPKGQVKLVSYKPSTKEWGALRYQLETGEKGWVGLSEITAHGDYVYIVERDNQIAENAKIKKLYRVKLADMVPAALGSELPVVAKEEVRDFLPDLKSLNGYVQDKIEGFAIDASGEGFAMTDNDGVDDHSGETLFFSIGKM